jgi:hypothetical protein
MKTYIAYQNGKLTMTEKGENKKKASNFIKKPTPVTVPVQAPNLKHLSIEKQRSLVAPPITEPLKNTFTPHHKQKPPSKKKSTQSGGKKIKASELQLQLFAKLCKIINIDSSNPIGIAIPFDKLQNDNVIRQLYDIQDKLKDAFPSSKLTALHSNAIKKQSFPGVNIVRQIFKEMGYKLRPVNTSEGYIGKKKILRREYHIEKL